MKKEKEGKNETKNENIQFDLLVYFDVNYNFENNLPTKFYIVISDKCLMKL